MRYIMWYLLAINIVTFFLIWNRQTEGAQKKVADTGGDASFQWRLLGGSVGACVGMQIFRHKTQKPKFLYWSACNSFVAGWNCDICLFEVGDKTPTFFVILY